MVEILKTLIILSIGMSSWLNELIINLPRYIKSIMENFLPVVYQPYFTAMENKIKWLLNKKVSKPEFEYFFAAISELFKLVYNNLFLELT